MGGMTVMALAAKRPELFAERVVGVGLVSTSAGGLGDLDLGLARLGKVLVRAAPGVVRLAARSPGLVAQGRKMGNDLETLLVRRYSFGSDVPPALLRFCATMIGSTRVDVISDFLPTFSRHDKLEALAGMSGAEVLVMVGDHDQLTPAAHSEEIARRLPDAEHVVIRNGGHLLMLEYPDVVTEHLEDLLARSAAAVVAVGRAARRRAWGRRTVTPVLPRRRYRPATGERRRRGSA